MLWRAIRFVIPVIATGVMFMSQVPPKDAATNLGKWWEFTGLPIPDWALAPRADRITFWAGAITLVVWSTWFFWDQLEPYAQTGWRQAQRAVGYIDGQWTWEFQVPWRSVGNVPTGVARAPTQDVWRERDRLEVYVIACRSVGVVPTLPVNRDPQNSRLRFLADAINDKRLAVASGDINGTGPADGVMTQIRYVDLRLFAEREKHADLLRFADEWSPPVATPAPPIGTTLKATGIVRDPVGTHPDDVSRKLRATTEVLDFLKTEALAAQQAAEPLRHAWRQVKDREDALEFSKRINAAMELFNQCYPKIQELRERHREFDHVTDGLSEVPKRDPLQNIGGKFANALIDTRNPEIVQEFANGWFAWTRDWRHWRDAAEEKAIQLKRQISR